jgi:hypothetical protein
LVARGKPNLQGTRGAGGYLAHAASSSCCHLALWAWQPIRRAPRAAAGGAPESLGQIWCLPAAPCGARQRQLEPCWPVALHSAHGTHGVGCAKYCSSSVSMALLSASDTLLSRTCMQHKRRDLLGIQVVFTVQGDMHAPRGSLWPASTAPFECRTPIWQSPPAQTQASASS